MKTEQEITDYIEKFITDFKDKNIIDPIKKAEFFIACCAHISKLESISLRLKYINLLSDDFRFNKELLQRKVNEFLRKKILKNTN